MEQLLQKTFWMTAEDTKLPKRQANLLRTRSRKLSWNIRRLWYKSFRVLWAAEYCLYQESWGLVFCAVWLVRSWSCRDRAWTPEVGESSTKLWSIRELLIPRDINRSGSLQRPPSQYQNQAQPGQQVLVPNCPTPVLQWNRKTMLNLSRQAAQSHRECIDTQKLTTGHGTTGRIPPNQETFTRHWSNSTHKEQTPQWRGTMILRLFPFFLFNHTFYFLYKLLPWCWPFAVLWFFSYFFYF